MRGKARAKRAASSGFDTKTAEQVRELMTAQDKPDKPTKEEESLLTFTSAVIIYERSDGIVEAFWFDVLSEAEEEWADIEAEYEGDEEDDEGVDEEESE